MPDPLFFCAMAQLEGTGNTNYVLLRDEKAYDEFKTLVELFGGTLAPEGRKDGRRLVSAFGHQEDGDFRRSLTVQELVASGYVSRHKESLLDAGRADYLALMADPELNADEEKDVAGEVDFLHEVYPLLAVGEALIFQRVGHEKRLSVTGWAEAISWEGQRISLSLDAIYQQAEKAFGPPFNRSSY